MKKEANKTTEKYLTERKFGLFQKSFEKHMLNIAKSFARHDEVSEMILKEIRNIHEENKYFRQSISDLSIDGSSYDRRINGLDIRVEKLESKLK